MNMKKIFKIFSTMVSIFVVTITIISPVWASGNKYTVYNLTENKETPISIANGKLSYGENLLKNSSVSPQQIIGDNNLIKMDDTTISAAYSSRTHLRVTFPNGKKIVGSGTMIGPCTLITAAHCVYSSDFGGFATSVVASPGRNGSNYPYGSTGAKEISIIESFKTKITAANDIAIVNLRSNIGSKSGHLICKYISDSVLTSSYTYLDLFGYPGTGYSTEFGKTTNGELWGMGASVLSVNGKYIKHEGDTYPGHSGSGLVYRGEYVVAVHNRYPTNDKTYNMAARIDAEYMKWITTLIEKVSAS